MTPNNIIRVFSDPHIGLTRTSHTTPASRLRLKQRLAERALGIIGVNNDPNIDFICLGDLFDSFTVDNASLMVGYQVFHDANLTLFGNHDLSNRSDTLSSIEVLSTVVGEPPRESMSAPVASVTDMFTTIWWVDHKLNQTIFEGALDDAYARAEPGQVLCLHCNYDSPFATQESTLNLTAEKAQHLLTKFSYILIGHEHAPRTFFDDRLILVGNTRPTGFADITNKYYWDLEIIDGKVVGVTRTLIWGKEYGYLSLDWTELTDLKSIGDRVEFIDVKGVAPKQHMPTISKQIADLWSLSDNLLMVRNNVVTEEAEEKDITIAVCQDIPTRIATELEGTKLAALFQSYLDRL